MTTVTLEGPVRRSSRKAQAPKRFQYSPETPGVKTPLQKKIRRTTPIEKERKDVGIGDGEVSSGANVGLSSYELERLENIRQNQAFLSSINLLQANEELKKLTRPKPSQRGLMRPKASVKEVLPARKSLRLQNIKAEPLALLPESRVMLVMQKKPKKPPGPLPVVAVKMEEGSKLPSQLLELRSEDSTEERKMRLDLKEYCSALESMRITKDRVAKVVMERIFSAAFHPCTSSLLLATGDKLGKVGLWKLSGDWGDDSVLLLEPHTGPVSCMAFSRAHPTQLLSLSYDGSLRCMDVEKAVFHDVYDTAEGLNTFDFMSHDCFTLVVGNSLGEVALVDRRTPGVVNIYNSRYRTKTESQAVSVLCGHSLSISSAYFSPHTGNRVLSTCMDNYIRIYDTSAMTTKSPLLTTIKPICTGQYLTKLSAKWDPKQEDCFVVSSMAHPRMVQVFHESGQTQHSIDSKHRHIVLSASAFHPTRDAFLGGDVSGRLYVFSD